MPEIRVNGVRLHYEEHGSGEPILCIHGTGSSVALWSAAAAELGRRGRAIVYDRRGFSRSERPEPFVTDVEPPLAPSVRRLPRPAPVAPGIGQTARRAA